MKIKDNQPVEKNKEYVVEVIDNGYDGEGIAKINDFTIFIQGAIKGEKCKIIIIKVNKTFAYGKIVEILKKVDSRSEIDCNTYKRCGGCDLRHVEYEYTLKMKKEIVQNLVDKNLKNQIEVRDTIGMEQPYYYRNKLQYPVGIGKDGQPVMGVFAKRSHEIIPVNDCFIQNKEAQKIAKYIFEFIKENKISVYNENTQKGKIRHIVVKIGVNTKEVMCILVTNEEEIEKEDILIKQITSKFKNVKTIIKNINNKNTNIILGKENIIIFGDGTIQDKLGEYTFKISPMSFYQINPIQTEILYNKAIEFADLNKEDILCDLYCGLGTIGIFASKYVKKVYGIEIVEEAIKIARKNAKLNDVENIEFMEGDVERVFENMLEEKQVVPTVIVVDPPRKGLDNHTVDVILNLKVSRIVYVSCNPATMVRDFKLLEDKYDVKKIQPVDMFPFTSHVECVSVLKLKQS